MPSFDEADSDECSEVYRIACFSRSYASYRSLLCSPANIVSSFWTSGSGSRFCLAVAYLPPACFKPCFLFLGVSCELEFIDLPGTDIPTLGYLAIASGLCRLESSRCALSEFFVLRSS